MNSLHYFFIGLIITLGLLWTDAGITLAAEGKTDIPSPRREFRAAWVATVANIDWPSKKGLSTAEQKEELVAILDRAEQLNLNALIFQVRPHCDALYESDLEPWSEYLTGTMGKAPDPYYDPLEFVIEQAHRRGIELHAWFNPYRALHSGANREVSEDHVSKTQPHIVREYGRQLWLDPGEPEAAKHSIAVIMDVVRRYDVDGVHFDDYFYPYQVRDEEGEIVDFPDQQSWERTVAEGETRERDDWRRENVNNLIQRLDEQIHQEKPWVKFGISPFGIWRPGNPPQIEGFDAYASLYADAKKWWTSGWLDYLTPQLYWKIEAPGQSFPVLLNWWQEENTHDRHLWPGMFTSRVGNRGSGNWKAEEILYQIYVTRGLQGATGNVHFSMKALMDDRGVAEALKEGPYRRPALIPDSPWMGGNPPKEPSLERVSSDRIAFSLPEQEQPWLWVIRKRTEDKWRISIQAGQKSHCQVSDAKQIAVSAVNRTGEAGPVAVLDLAE